MSKMAPKKILIPSIVLTVICLVITAALAFTNDITKDKIKENDLNEQQLAMAEIFADAEFQNAEVNGTEYSIAKKDGEVVGYVFTTSKNGYGGEVKVMTGITAEGKVSSVEVIACDNETPGLGQNVKGNAEFLGQFEGKEGSISTEKNKEIDAITSATITTTAVIENVNEALDLYKNVKGGGK